MKVLSIDAWRNDCGWDWNNWFTVAEIDQETFLGLKTNRMTLKLLREELGLLTNDSKGRVALEDDGYNVVVVEKGNRRPLLAIEYGAELY